MTLNGSFDFIGRHQTWEMCSEANEREKRNKIKFLFIYFYDADYSAYSTALCVQGRNAQKTVSELQFNSSGIRNAINFMFFLWFYYCILLWSPLAPFLCVCNVCFQSQLPKQFLKFFMSSFVLIWIWICCFNKFSSSQPTRVYIQITSKFNFAATTN